MEQEKHRETKEETEALVYAAWPAVDIHRWMDGLWKMLDFQKKELQALDLGGEGCETRYSYESFQRALAAIIAPELSAACVASSAVRSMLQEVRPFGPVFVRPTGATNADNCASQQEDHGDTSVYALRMNYHAQRLDNFYAKLVRGAAVNTRLTMVWAGAMEVGPPPRACLGHGRHPWLTCVRQVTHSPEDAAEYKKLVWALLGHLFGSSLPFDRDTRERLLEASPNKRGKTEVKKAEEEGQGQTKDAQHLFDQMDALHGMGLLASARRIRSIAAAMDEVWESSETFKVTDVVHMVEMEIMRRLQADGVFPFLRETMQKGIYDYSLCFLMRRHPVFRYQFAQAVGKRFLSGRIVAGQRAQLVEHHRTAQWAEQEYAALHRLLTEKQHELRNALTEYKALMRVSCPPIVMDADDSCVALTHLWQAGRPGMEHAGREGCDGALPRLHSHAGDEVSGEGGCTEEYARRTVAGLQCDGRRAADMEALDAGVAIFLVVLDLYILLSEQGDQLSHDGVDGPCTRVGTLSVDKTHELVERGIQARRIVVDGHRDTACEVAGQPLDHDKADGQPRSLQQDCCVHALYALRVEEHVGEALRDLTEARFVLKGLGDAACVEEGHVAPRERCAQGVALQLRRTRHWGARDDEHVLDEDYPWRLRGPHPEEVDEQAFGGQKHLHELLGDVGSL